MVAESNILLQRKIFSLSSATFSLKKWEREIDTNMEAIEDAENIIHPLLEKNDIDEEVKKTSNKCKSAVRSL